MFVFGLVLSACIGAALGLLGGGGSILTVPLLHYVFDQSAHAAAASSLAIIAVTAVAALVPYIRRGHVRWRIGILFGTASMSGAYGGARLAYLVPPAVLLTAFALVTVGAAIAMLHPRRLPPSPKELPPQLAIVLGIAVGMVAGLVGAGGGFLIVPTLVALGQFTLLDAIGTSLLVIVMNSSAGFVGARHGVTLDVPLLAVIAGVAVVGSVASRGLSARISQPRLRSVFGWFLLATGAFVLLTEAPGAFGYTLDL